MTAPFVTLASAHMFPPSAVATACDIVVGDNVSNDSTTFTSRVSVTRRLSPRHATLALARTSYLMLAGPNLTDDGDERGRGIRKKNVVSPRRAA